MVFGHNPLFQNDNQPPQIVAVLKMDKDEKFQMWNK